MPCTRSRDRRRRRLPVPMRQVPTGCRFETPRLRMSSISLLVGLDGGPRHHLLRDIGLEGRLLGDLPREPHAIEHGIDVVGGLEELELDLGRGQRIGGS